MAELSYFIIKVLGLWIIASLIFCWGWSRFMGNNKRRANRARNTWRTIK